MIHSHLRLSGLRTRVRSPDSSVFNASRDHRRGSSRQGHRGLGGSRDHHRGNGIRPGCRPTLGPKSRQDTTAGTDRVEPEQRAPLPNRRALVLWK
jgi:hypothetical protein